ncbi:MAG: VOC family protein [Pseudomonadota bacterium]
MKNLIPMLNVADIERSLTFYRQALHFELVSDPELVAEWRWATIRSGSIELMLSETECPPRVDIDMDPHANVSWPCIFYCYPDNVGELYWHVAKKGFKPTKLDTTHYGMREFSLQDPDGHMLSFG